MALVETCETISEDAGNEFGAPGELTTTGILLHPKGVKIPQNALEVSDFGERIYF